MDRDSTAPDAHRPALSRRLLLAGALGGACCTALTASQPSSAPSTGTIPEWLAVDPWAVTHPVTRRPHVALTFDDGPDPWLTPLVLETLRRFGHHATFFVVASNARAWPHLVEQVLAQGHEVANHSGLHEHLDQVSADRAWTSLEQGDAELRRLGSTSRLMRPPWGHTSSSVTFWARRRDIRQVFWTLTLDGAVRNVGDRAGATLSGLLTPGEIVLAHDGTRVLGSSLPRHDRSRAIGQLPSLLAGLDARGLRSVPVSQML